MAFRHKVAKVIELNDFHEDYEVIPRNYGYEIKLYGAMGSEASYIAWSLQQMLGYGEFILISRKKYESIKCKL